MKVFMFFINLIYWLGIFIVPAGVIGFLALWLYVDSSRNTVLSIIIGAVGVVIGIALAEFVRKRYGLDNFYGRRLATPDIDDRNILDEENKENELK